MSSMKSFRSGAPVFPPPPYTWLIATKTGAETSSVIDAVEERPCASAIATGRPVTPAGVPAPIVARNEKTLSPGVTSPLVPSSANDCDGAPPIAVRSPVTVSPVLVGLAPGVTVTVSSVDSPSPTRLGDAAPVPVGFVVVGTPLALKKKLSTARPSSAPVALKSVHRMKNIAPGGMLNPVMSAERITRFTLPSSAPAIPS